MDPIHMSKKLDCIVIGAGMAGILAAIQLKNRGDNVVVLEKGDSVGGTWRENRYPGLTCDVPAHAYTYSFAPNPEWSRYFSPGPEIHEYFKSVVAAHGIDKLIRFGAEVTEARWDNGQWLVNCSDGSHYKGQVLIAATGVLHHPRYPDIKGLDAFSGRVEHSARWPADLDLRGKRLAIIGNGSTGVQMICATAGVAAHVDHFQRSPQWIMPVQDFAYSDEDRARFRKDPAAIDAIRYNQEYFDNVRRFNNAIVEPDGEPMKIIEDYVRSNLEMSVSDPELRERLRPDYKAACKRLIYSADYYEKVQRPDVSLVREGISHVSSEGIVTRDGQLHRCDVIALCTGFHADRFVRPMKMTGRDGADINQVWARRPTAYYALTLPDFPNCFMLNGPTGPVGNFSLIDIAEAQWGYVEKFLDLLRAGQADAISPRHEAMADYEVRRIAAAKTTVFGSGCSSWYLDAEGVPATWPWSYDSFFEEMKNPRMKDFDLR